MKGEEDSAPSVFQWGFENKGMSSVTSRFVKLHNSITNQPQKTSQSGGKPDCAKLKELLAKGLTDYTWINCVAKALCKSRDGEIQFKKDSTPPNWFPEGDQFKAPSLMTMNFKRGTLLPLLFDWLVLSNDNRRQSLSQLLKVEHITSLGNIYSILDSDSSIRTEIVKDASATKAAAKATKAAAKTAKATNASAAVTDSNTSQQ